MLKKTQQENFGLLQVIYSVRRKHSILHCASANTTPSCQTKYHRNHSRFSVYMPTLNGEQDIILEIFGVNHNINCQMRKIGFFSGFTGTPGTQQESLCQFLTPVSLNSHEHGSKILQFY